MNVRTRDRDTGSPTAEQPQRSIVADDITPISPRVAGVRYRGDRLSVAVSPGVRSPLAAAMDDVHLLVRRVLLELALEAAAVDAEPAGGLGDVATGVGEHAVDVLPLGTGK